MPTEVPPTSAAWGVAIIVAAVAAGGLAGARTHRLESPRVDRSVPLADAPLRTGDLLLCRSDGALASRLPRLLGDCPFTHVAVVFVEPATGHRYAWDICDQNPRRASAPRTDLYLHPIREFVGGHYASGTVYVRYLDLAAGVPAGSPPVRRAEAQARDEDFREFMRQHWDDHRFLGPANYPNLQRRFLGSIPVGLPPPPTRAAGSDLMCVDLVRLTLEAIGVARPRADHEPMLATIDFCSRDIAGPDALLELNERYAYGPEVLLRLDA